MGVMQMPSEMAASRSPGALAGDSLEIGGWRFAIGDGPFRIKGTPYLGHMKYVEEELPGGKEAMLARIDDPALREFLSQQFLASSLYDIYPLVAAALPCAEILGIDPREFVLMRASKQAASDLKGVYRFLLALVSTKTLASRIPLLVKQIYEFGAVRIEEMHQGRVMGYFTGVPQHFAIWLGCVAESYLGAVIRSGGAKKVEIFQDEPQLTGVEHGVQMCSVSFDIMWE